MSSALRHPKTTQEKRASYACHHSYIRDKRSKNNLPSYYDDIARNDSRWGSPVSWKRKKLKKQWEKHKRRHNQH